MEPLPVPHPPNLLYKRKKKTATRRKPSFYILRLTIKPTKVFTILSYNHVSRYKIETEETPPEFVIRFSPSGSVKKSPLTKLYPALPSTVIVISLQSIS